MSTDVESREREPNVAEMPDAISQSLVACSANPGLTGSSLAQQDVRRWGQAESFESQRGTHQALVKHTILSWFASLVDVVHAAVGNLQDTLVYDVLVGLDAKLEVPEPLR